jgi:hypothetical protein
MAVPGPEGLWEYAKTLPERLREQFLAGMGAFAETRQPAHLAGALNPLSPLMQDAAVQAGGLIAPQVNALSQSVSQGSENLGFGPLSIPDVTDEQLAPLLMLGMGGRNKMGFYSPSGKALTTAPGKGQPGQYLAHLKKEPGATREAKETGLLQALEEAPGTLTKEEVVSMWNPIELDETVKGDLSSAREINLDSPYAIPEVLNIGRIANDNPGDLELTLVNDSDTYQALESQFPDLMEKEDWGEIVVNSVFGGESKPSDLVKYAHQENLNLPGGSNPKEILVQLPTQEDSAPLFTEWMKSKGYDPAYRTNYVREYQREHPPKDVTEYKGGHWSEPNVLAHIRTNERDVGGVKALHIEEIQSDWHQAGQKKGYKRETVEDVQALAHADKERFYSGKGYTTDDEWDALSEKVAQWDARERVAQKGVPDAPYKKDWHELAFKRALMEGINDPSIERLTWTTGDVQKERYNLAKYINSIEAQAVGDNFNLAVTHKDGHAQNLQNVTPDELADHVGKEMAEKIVSDVVAPNYGVVKTSQGYEITVDGELEGGWYDSEKEAQHAISQYETGDMEGFGGKPATYSGLDLEVGGEYHKQLYDGKITKFAKKFLKKYGVEPERISEQADYLEEYEIIAEDYPPDRTDDQHHLYRNGEWIDSFPSRKEAEDYLNKQQNIWSIDITPEMRQDLQQKGVPLTMNDKKPLLAYA